MREESYAAGYRAGHLQGWLDAMAQVDRMRQAGPLSPKPMGETPLAPAAPGFPPAQVPAPPINHGMPVPPAAVPHAGRAETAVGTARPEVPRPALPPTPPRPAVEPALTAAERQARRERRDRQNINITLYVASLLLVAAAALFVGSGLPPMMRFAGVGAVTALFYGLGLGLHARTVRLQPAAVAFAGTGLALVPVLGLALYNFAWHNGPAAWLVTSLIGTAAYVVAAVRLDSKVLAYLSLTFVLSSAWSGVAVLGGALVWYYTVLIGAAVGFTLLSRISPAWLPPVIAGPLLRLHPYVVPGVAAAATLSPLLPAAPGLTKAQYALVLGACGAYFAVVALLEPALRLAYFRAARAALTVAAVVGTWTLTGHGTDALFALAVLAACQSVAIAFLGVQVQAWIAPASGRPGAHHQTVRTVQPPASARWRRDAYAMFGLHFTATAAFALCVIVAGFFRPERTAAAPVPLWIALALSLVTALALAAGLRGAAEAAPVPSLLMAAIVSHHGGEWTLTALLALAAAFWAVRAYAAAGALRRLMVFNARVAATFVAVAAAAALADGPGRDSTVWFVLVAAAAAQQVASAVMQRYGVPALAPETSHIGLAVVGLGGIAALSQTGGPGSSALTWAAVLVQVGAAFAAGLLLAETPTEGRSWRPRAGEVVPPLVAALLAVFAFERFSQAAGNLVLLLLVLYLVVSALGLQARWHRQAYWWSARTAGTVLALTAFAQLTDTVGGLVIAAEPLHPASVLFAAVVAQLVFPLVGYVSRRTPQGAVIDAGLLILLQLACCAVLAQQASGTWQYLAAASGTAAAAGLAAGVMRAERITVVFVPVAFLVLFCLSVGNARAVELLLGIFAVFAALMVVAVPEPRAKGWYFLAARILPAALAVVLTDDVTASAAVVSVAFAIVLAAQHVIRWMMRFRLTDVPFQQAAVWITLAGQALLPLAFALQHSGAGWGAVSGSRIPGGEGIGSRGVLLVELALLVVSAVVARLLFDARGALYFGVYGLLFGVVSLSPVMVFGDVPLLGFTGTAAALLAVGLLAAGAGPRLRRHGGATGPERVLWLVAAGSFCGAALCVSPWAAPWVPGTAVLAIATVLLVASHVEAVSALYLPASAAVLAGTFMLATAWLDGSAGAAGRDWALYLPWLVGPGAAAVAMYVLRRVRAAALAADPLRRWSLAAGAFAGLAATAMVGLSRDATAWAGVGVWAAAAAVAVSEAGPRLRRPATEVAAMLVTAAVQRAALFEAGPYGHILPWPAVIHAGPFWLAQWYVVLAAVLAALRYLAGQSAVGRRYAYAAAGVLSLTGLGTVFGGEASQQLWVLVWLSGLLVAGLVVGDRVLVRWGAAGIAVCVLWAMRQYTFALLAVVAVALIALAIWRLNRGPAGGDKAGSAP